MKRLLQLCVAVLAMAGFQQAQAVPFTNYLDGISNVIAYANYVASTNPEAPAKVRAILGKALKDFQKPSTSVAGDYKIFIAVATHLMPLQTLVDPALSGPLGFASSNAFTNFVLEATAEVNELFMRQYLITPFQPLRRAASNQVAGAIRALSIAGTTTNINLGILSVGLGLNKLVVARKLVNKAELKQGFAPDLLDDTLLRYTIKGSEKTASLFGNTTYTNSEGDTGTFTYTRTGLSTATLVFVSQTGEGTTTVKLRFTALDSSSAEGTFTLRNSEGGAGASGKGTFTVTP